MANQAIVVAGEAPETDDDEDEEVLDDGCGGSIANDHQHRQSSSQEPLPQSSSSGEWKPADLMNRVWTMHVDEKLEQRWKTLGADTRLFANRQGVNHKKQIEMIKSATANTQHIVQEVSFTLRKASENLTRLEANVSLLLEGAKFVPDLLPVSSSNSNTATTTTTTTTTSSTTTNQSSSLSQSTEK